MSGSLTRVPSPSRTESKSRPASCTCTWRKGRAASEAMLSDSSDEELDGVSLVDEDDELEAEEESWSCWLSGELAVERLAWEVEWWRLGSVDSADNALGRLARGCPPADAAARL